MWRTRFREARFREGRSRDVAVRLAAWVPFLAPVLLLVSPVGCSDRDRRMGEFEALEYRRDLVRGHYAELSPQQRRDLMYHPGRTARQIDRTFDAYRRQFAEQQARDAAAARDSRRRGSVAEERLRRAASSELGDGSASDPAAPGADPGVDAAGGTGDGDGAASRPAELEREAGGDR